MKPKIGSCIHFVVSVLNVSSSDSEESPSTCNSKEAATRPRGGVGDSDRSFLFLQV